MERIETKGEVTNIQWKAVDGEIFDSRDECEVYEKSARCFIGAKYRKCVVGTVTEDELWWGGNCEENIDIVKVTSDEDRKAIMQMRYYVTGEIKEDDANTFLDELKDGIVLIYRGYENDYFNFMGTVDSIVKQIKDVVKNIEKENKNKE